MGADRKRTASTTLNAYLLVPCCEMIVVSPRRALVTMSELGGAFSGTIARYPSLVGATVPSRGCLY